MPEKNKARGEDKSPRAGGMFDSGGPSSRVQNTTSRARCQALLEKHLFAELNHWQKHSDALSALCAGALLELWADVEDGLL